MSEIPIDIAIKALSFIKNNNAPLLVNDFINHDLTGDQIGDAFLREMKLALLDFMKKDGIVDADILTLSEAKIYGLTAYGIKLHDTFINLQSTRKAE